MNRLNSQTETAAEETDSPNQENLYEKFQFIKKSNVRMVSLQKVLNKNKVSEKNCKKKQALQKNRLYWQVGALNTIEPLKLIKQLV